MNESATRRSVGAVVVRSAGAQAPGSALRRVASAVPSPARPSTRRRVSHGKLLATLVLAMIVACGPDETGGPGAAREPGGAPALHERLALHVVGATPSDRSAAREARIVETYDLGLDAYSWSVDAPFQRLARRLDAETDGGPSHELILRATHKGESMSFTRTGDFDPAAFNRIRLPMRFDGQGYVRADFRRDGVLLGRTEAVRILPTEDQGATGMTARFTELSLPPEMRFEQPFDTLKLHVTGVYRMVALSHVLLVKQPPESMLPDAAEGGELMRIGLVGRRSVGLLAGVPLQARVEIPRGAELRFALGQPVAELRSSGSLQVEVRVDGEEVAGFELPPLSAKDDAWHDHVVDLSDFVGLSAVVSFELVAADPDRIVGCALAEAALVVPDDRAPTVLLITSDTHRADHVGFARDGVSIVTPVIDALAERGTVFEDCFTPVNVTNPSHVAMMTARSVRTTGVRTNYSRLSDAAPTLAEAFADAGWMTMAAVSTRHLGADGSGLGQGFDRMSWPRVDPRRRAIDTLADVLRWLPAAEGRPLFLWVHVFDAHWPYEPETDWEERYYPSGRDPRDPSLPEPAVDPARFKPELAGVRDLDWPRAQYKAEISGQDALLEDLLERPRFVAGTVAFVADHGESLGEHGIFFDHIGLYPGVLHIPLVLAGPGVPVGERTEQPVMHTDLARTLLDLAGLESTPFPGRNLLTAAAPEPRFAIEGYGFSASITHNGMHLVQNLAGRQLETVLEQPEHHQVELYDLNADPECRHDILEERLEVARSMRARLIHWLTEVPERGWSEERQDDEAFIESLKQLGYVEPMEQVSAALWQPDDCAWCARFDR